MRLPFAVSLDRLFCVLDRSPERRGEAVVVRLFLDLDERGESGSVLFRNLADQVRVLAVRVKSVNGLSVVPYRITASRKL